LGFDSEDVSRVIPILKNYEINWTARIGLVRIDQTIRGYEELDAAKNVLALPQSVIHFSILSKYWEILTPGYYLYLVL
jgi:hypothetical protein